MYRANKVVDAYVGVFWIVKIYEGHELVLQENKYETLCDIYGTVNVTQAVIFCNTRRKVDMLASMMQHDNYTVSCMVSWSGQRSTDFGN